ncbi:putative ABC transport system permease protein [Hypnocyclicus thermotrophus]|uniref:ABC transport system permease protein n=1 Tax=Hypnocyclicus thermotrophus TaxID=1627895 RepID=A0AA46DXB5_9FUSO|nr:ABC transporter permease [Hypnocyclicus thermotrophus]TDT67348.1 putative ABC transport system permease protein [Hypnocyclicus thermotrophus]
MNINETLKSAFQSLVSNKIRSSLTMLGIIIGISSVIMISMIGKGSQQSITGDLKDVMDRTVTISVQSDDEVLSKKDYITKDDLEEISKINGIEGITPDIASRGGVMLNEKRKFSKITGTNENGLYVNGYDLLYGREFTEEEVEKADRVVLIDDVYAMKRFGRIDVVGEELKIDVGGGKSYNFIIVGIFENPMKSLLSTLGGREMYFPFLPYTTFQKYVNDTQISQIKFKINDINQKDSIADKVVSYLEKSHNKKDIYEIGSSSSPLDSFNNILSTVSLLLTSVAAISLLVGGIGVMNIMLVTVTERTREIGIRKAIGAKNKDILTQFLIESVTLTLVGGLLGIVLGYSISTIVGNIMNIQPILSIWMLMLAVFVSGGIGVIFGTFPAKKAAELNPIDALRHE